MRAGTLFFIATAIGLGCSASFTDKAAPGGTGAGGSGNGGATSTTTSTTSSGPTTGGNNTGGGINLGGAAATTTGGATDCSSAAELVYVFSLAGDIYSFDPPTKQFTKIATPDCPPGAGQANSMAVDRNLVAWINYIGGIYKFDLNTKTGCTLALTLPDGYTQCGMGFATDAAGGTSETLYIDGIGGAGLAKIDMTSMTVVPIGNFSSDSKLTGQSCELTGTGDARLFGYFTTSPDVRVAQIDPTSGGILSDNQLANFPPPSDWAFSFWGGDFYLYAAPIPGSGTSNSSVVHYSPATNTVDLAYVKNVGFQIVGAGVSTCAPLVPPT